MPKEILCLHCNSTNTVKKGFRKNKLHTIQKFFCKSCGKFFTLSPMKNKTYPPKIILDSISAYNIGHTLEKTSKIINKKYKVKLPVTTLNDWLDEFKPIYRKIRKSIIKKYNPSSLIQKKTFHHHKQIFDFRLHKAKLDMYCKFPSLKDYLENIEKNCPNDLFESNKRISEIKQDAGHIKVYKKYNYACKLADLALKITKNNKQRHNIIENFMLINDIATIATEIPVYVKIKNRIFTGHIDLIQIRFNKIYVLDFKPEAEKDNPIVQLYLYALGLSKITNIPLKNFRCAYFDDNNYFEFYPRYIKIM